VSEPSKRSSLAAALSMLLWRSASAAAFPAPPPLAAAAASAIVLLLAGGHAAAFQRTEVREPCGGRDPSSYSPSERRPFFGELHIHTSYSLDAFVFNVRNDPRASYDFARGMPLTNGIHTLQLDRPLDFAAVTDHAEGFGPSYICATPGTTGYEAAECVAFRNETPVPPRFTLLALIATVGGARPINLPMCSEPGVDCDGAAASVWLDTQAAAEEAYDRTQACRFTSFVGYEWTPMPGAANLHRNVIFRNERVPEKPIDYFETETWEATRLWELLRERCLERDGGVLGVGSGCDVLTIPHNSNLSEGLMFPDPADTDIARERQLFEPLVEVIQHKGSSECRFDPFYGYGTDTTDEQCAFELLDMLTLFPLPGPSTPKPPESFARRAYIRNVLKDGLALGEGLGVNPFKLGMIGSTDGHAAAPGNTGEASFRGHVGTQDDTATKRVSDGNGVRFGPGGLAVVWAEENSRDSLFEAMQRREAYGTSGTRPIVRFFGGWGYPADLCERADQIDIAYADGVPMGGDLPPATSAAPRFFAAALSDSMTATPLQQIQIVKGWVDERGAVHERVYGVDGGPSDAGVDPATCQRTGGEGLTSRCVMWNDPEFDPQRPAFYYARVLEEPTCRWHTFDCKSLGVDPFASDCASKALSAVPGSNLSDCCRLRPTVQERAWTSPIWYEPRQAPLQPCAESCLTSPAAACEMPQPSQAAQLTIDDDADNDRRDRLQWRWSGELADGGFGDPTDATSLALCVYDGDAELVASACAEAAGVCDGKPCWKAAGSGYTYADPNHTPYGIDRIVLKARNGRGKILLKARGGNLGMPALPMTLPATVQLRSSDGACWEAEYPSARTNDPTGLRAKSR